MSELITNLNILKQVIELKTWDEQIKAIASFDDRVINFIGEVAYNLLYNKEFNFSHRDLQLLVIYRSSIKKLAGQKLTVIQKRRLLKRHPPTLELLVRPVLKIYE